MSLASLTRLGCRFLENISEDDSKVFTYHNLSYSCIGYSEGYGDVITHGGRQYDVLVRMVVREDVITPITMDQTTWTMDRTDITMDSHVKKFCIGETLTFQSIRYRIGRINRHNGSHYLLELIDPK